jgi:hypothetical protein
LAYGPILLPCFSPNHPQAILKPEEKSSCFLKRTREGTSLLPSAAWHGSISLPRFNPNHPQAILKPEDLKPEELNFLSLFSSRWTEFLSCLSIGSGFILFNNQPKAQHIQMGHFGG